MRSSFEDAIDHIFKYEGGFVNHPLDPGGATNMGITRRTLSQYRGHKVSVLQVKHLQRSEAADIYKARYWDAIKGDQLPAGIDFAVFDSAVNQGVRKATKMLQKAAGVRADGVIGPVTMGSIHAKVPAAVLNEFMARRMNHYGRLSSLFRTFGLGWSRRLISTQYQATLLLSANNGIAGTWKHAA